jgi:hypothetical protein
LKSNSLLPGGSSKSKPTWSNTDEVFDHVGFFFRFADSSCDRCFVQPESKRTLIERNERGVLQWSAKVCKHEQLNSPARQLRPVRN